MLSRKWLLLGFPVALAIAACQALGGPSGANSASTEQLASNPTASLTAVAPNAEAAAKQVAVYWRIKMDSPLSLEDMEAKYMPTLENMRTREGLIRKISLRSEDGKTVGGIYLWANWDYAAYQLEPDLWATVSKKYGDAQVSVTPLWSPLVVDNLLGQALFEGEALDEHSHDPLNWEEDGMMYTVVVQIPLASPVTAAKHIESAKTLTSNYAEVNGLVRKYFIRSDEGDQVGGVLQFMTKEAADGFINAAWIENIRNKYGTEPIVQRYYTPWVVNTADSSIVGIN
ncbi:MAG: hypothetical protein QNJ46_06590 [Leptolyngbyaceae cyanobacterium MO_188.B28]|nr:hypothetical protein [Leptolyngbyaceae cyanobacterium MO_188.B28]